MFRNSNFLELELEEQIQITNDIAKEETGFTDEVKVVPTQVVNEVFEEVEDDMEEVVEEVPEEIEQVV